MQKTKLNYQDRLNRVRSPMKLIFNNNMIDCIGAVYTENDIKQSRLIGLGAIFDENQTRQRCDRSYR